MRAGAGLFLDLDGTLANSLPAMRTAYARFLHRFGQTGSDAEFDSLNGPPLDRVVATLAVTYELAPPLDELIAIYRDTIRGVYDEVVPNDGAGQLLGTAKRLGLKTGVVTSNSAALTSAWLRRVGFLELIDTVVTGDDVSLGKPSPEPYLLALERSGCLTTASLAVEDSPAGARASIAAGIQTFFLSNSQENVPQGARAIACLNDVTEFLDKCDQDEGGREQ